MTTASCWSSGEIGNPLEEDEVTMNRSHSCNFLKWYGVVAMCAVKNNVHLYLLPMYQTLIVLQIAAQELQN